MAIHPNTPGIEVGIEVADQRAVEYDDNDDSTPAGVCVKYIETVSGADFIITPRFDVTTFPFAQEAVSFMVRIDGEFVRR